MLEEIRTYSNYAKLVTTANDIEDSLRILDLYKNTHGLILIAFAMGESGIISRIFSTLLKRTASAPFTYAALEKRIAPGQLTLKQMKRLYNRIGLCLGAAETKPPRERVFEEIFMITQNEMRTYCIIGDPIKNSLSPAMHNSIQFFKS